MKRRKGQSRLILWKAGLLFGNLNDRKRVLIVVSIMAGATLAATGISIWLLYETAFDGQRARLVELAQSQARLIEAVARFDAAHSQSDHPLGSAAATLSQIVDAHAKSTGFGETGEFTLAKRQSASILFLLSHRHHNLDTPVPWDSGLAEPMRRALQGRSGTVVGVDYRGVTVLAAHEPVAVLNFGIVAKIDLAEIRAPFLRAAAISGIGAFVLVVLGGLLVRFVATPIIERERAEKALRASQERFRDFAETASDWFWETDDKLRLTYLSDRYFEITGLPPADIIGHTQKEIYQRRRPTSKPGESEKWRRHFQCLDNRQAYRDLEISIDLPGGRRRISLNSGRPVFSEAGDFLGYRGTSVDITDRKQAEAAMLAAKEEAELASRAKSEFLAVMSHELRTPLNAILGFSQVIGDQRLGPVNNAKYLEYIEDIRTSGVHLLEIVNDMLDLAKIDAGQSVLEDETVDPRDAVESGLRLIRERARDSGIAIETRFGEPLPALRADGRRLRQILINLLSNAVKFTERGGSITVDARLDDNGDLLIAVGDTGIGMKPDDIPRALEPFTQVEVIMTRRHEGTGLGLPLVRALCELHGGDLELTSAPGEGTVATVRFPASRVVAESGDREVADAGGR